MQTSGAKQKVTTQRESSFIEAVFLNGATAPTAASYSISGATSLGLVVPAALNGKTLTITVAARQSDSFVTLAGFTPIVLATGAAALSSANMAALASFSWIKLSIDTAVGADATLFITMKG